MAYTRTWDSSNEASPADSDQRSAGAGKIRNLKVDVRERIAKDHYMDIAGTDADHGEHVKVTLRVGSAPTQAANKGILYAKDVLSKAELFYIDEDGDEVQITSGGELNYSEFASGTIMFFYQDTAPTGWTIDDTLDDKALIITKGSAAGGETGGGAHSSGTWTQPSHTHTGPSHTHTGPSHVHGLNSHTHTIAHTHSVPATNTGWGSQSGNYGALGVSSASLTLAASNNLSTGASSSANSGVAAGDTEAGGTGNTGASGTGATGSSATANTWRPAAYCAIIAEKD